MAKDNADTIVEAISSLWLIMPFLKGIPVKLRSTIMSLA
jgi:hypothetical protein